MSGVEPHPKSNLMYFSLKVWHLVARILIFFENQLPSLSNNGLSFWVAIRQSTFPLLSPLTLDLVAARVSQAYVERVFSVCGELTSAKHNRLTKNLEQCCFLKVNKKFFDIELLLKQPCLYFSFIRYSVLCFQCDFCGICSNLCSLCWLCVKYA